MQPRKRNRAVARILALLALLAVGFAIWAVVNGKIDDATKDSTTAAVSHKPKRKKPKHHTYVIKSGDTLSAIAIRNHVSKHWILKINPDLNPNALQLGQVIKLTR